MKTIRLLKGHKTKQLPPQKIEEVFVLRKEASRESKINIPYKKWRTQHDHISVQYAILWIDLRLIKSELSDDGGDKFTISATQEEKKWIELRTGIPFKSCLVFWKRQKGKRTSKFKKILRSVLIQEYRELSEREHNRPPDPITKEKKIFLIDRVEAIDKLE